jgi:anti-sigma B factor antagonist
MQPPRTDEQDGVLILHLDDPAALNEAPGLEFRELILRTALDRPGRPVALDLGRIDQLASPGIGTLVGLKRRLEARGGRLALYRVPPPLLEVFHIMSLDSFFTIVPDRPAAVELLRAESPV